VGLPSDLLRRRPDIREAERRLAAANAEIGVQTAKLYPSLDLLALSSFAGTSIGSLFDRDNLQSAALGGLTQPLFNGGAAKAAVKIAREQRDQALLAYKQTVLSAFQNVEDALARLRADEARDASLARSLTASTAALSLAQSTYRTGLSPFINVLQAETARLQAQDQELQARAAALSDLIALDKALGGDQGEGAPARDTRRRAGR
jgi:outer membrane protein TolC